MSEKYRDLRAETGVALTLALLAILPFLRVVLQSGHWPYLSDALFFDLEMTGRLLAHSGELPLWNLYNGLGAPAFTDPRLLIYYPISFIVRLFPLNAGMNVDFILHFWLGGLGFYYLMRDLTPGSRWPAFFSAVAFMCTGAFFPRISDVHIDTVRATAWAGWLLWSYRRLILRPSGLWVVNTAVFTVMIVVSGHLFAILRILLLILVYAAYRVGQYLARAQWRQLSTMLAWSTLAALLALALAAYKILPSLDVFSRLARVQDVYTASQAGGVRLSMVQLTGIAIPLQWYDIPADSMFAFSDFIETAIYAGLITVLVGVLAFLSPDRNQRRRAILVLLFGLIGLGLASNLFSYWNLVYSIAPFMRMPGRFSLWWVISMCMLGGLGFDALLHHHLFDSEATKRPLTWLLIGTIGAMLLCAVIAVLWLARGPDLAGWILNQGYFSGITAATLVGSQWYSFAALTLTLAMVAALLWMVRRGMRASIILPLIVLALAIETQFYAWPLVKPWEAEHSAVEVWPEGAAYLDPAVIRLEEPVYRYGIPGLSANRDRTDLVELREIRQLGLDGGRGSQLASSGFVVAESADRGDPRLHPTEIDWLPPLYEYEGNLPRLYLVPAITIVENDDDALAYVASDSFDPYGQAVVTIEHGVAPPDLPLHAAQPVEQRARITEYRNNHLEAEVTVDQPVMAVFSEMVYPGWKAWLDGLPVKIWQTNYTLRGILVEPGTHTIIMRYQPLAPRIGYGLSAASLVVILVTLGRAINQHRKDARSRVQA